jgi:hypothetical protein
VSTDTRHLTIDVRVDGDQISGHVGDGTDRPTTFLGWLGPIGALDRLLGIPSSTTEEPHAPDEGAP